MVATLDRTSGAWSHYARGVGDINGDGDLDIVRADTWFENKDGKGLEWVAHKNIPMGAKDHLEFACAQQSWTWTETASRKWSLRMRTSPDQKLWCLRMQMARAANG